jgi:hypothetical protein
MAEGQGANWGGMLDKLSKCITRQEEVHIRDAAVDRGSPSHLVDLHNHVARLLVKHDITTWHQLRTSFPASGEHPTCQ